MSEFELEEVVQARRFEVVAPILLGGVAAFLLLQLLVVVACTIAGMVLSYVSRDRGWIVTLGVLVVGLAAEYAAFRFAEKAVAERVRALPPEDANSSRPLGTAQGVPLERRLDFFAVLVGVFALLASLQGGNDLGPVQVLIVTIEILLALFLSVVIALRWLWLRRVDVLAALALCATAWSAWRSLS